MTSSLSQNSTSSPQKVVKVFDLRLIGIGKFNENAWQRSCAIGNLFLWFVVYLELDVKKDLVDISSRVSGEMGEIMFDGPRICVDSWAKVTLLNSNMTSSELNKGYTLQGFRTRPKPHNPHEYFKSAKENREKSPIYSFLPSIKSFQFCRRIRRQINPPEIHGLIFTPFYQHKSQTNLSRPSNINPNSNILKESTL